MSGPEHISTILIRALKELEQTWDEEKKGMDVEIINQEKLAEAGKF